MKKHERGWIPAGIPIPPLWVCLAIALALAVLYGVYQKHRAEDKKAQLVAFKESVRRVGEQAAARAKAQKIADQKANEDADAKNRFDMAALRVDIERVRRANANRSLVPAAPAGTRRPDLVCFDRAEFDTALRAFTGDVRGGAEEGATCAVNLNTARAWAAATRPPPR